MEPTSNTASNTVTQREADRDLLRILEGQNHMLAREQSRLFFSNVILAIAVVAVAFESIGIDAATKVFVDAFYTRLMCVKEESEE